MYLNTILIKTNEKMKLSVLILLIYAVISPCFLFGQAEPSESTVPSEYLKHFFGAAHLKTQYHPFAKETGVTWSRVGTRWHKQEPRKDQYNFAEYDELVRSAQKHNIEVLPLIGHTAGWASSAPDNAEHKDKYPPSDEMIEQWEEYVTEVVQRYPDIQYFEIWNEPNIDWFLRADQNYKVYVDKILIPAAKIIHDHGRKVVGLSYTTEWPDDSWPPEQRPRHYSENVAANILDVNRWLNYHEAWKYIDIIAVHYTHGDAEKHSEPYAENMMPFYDYMYANWIKTGKVEGIWNTEAGMAGVEAGMQGFVALDPWEHPPYGQWVARYTIPFIHWGLQHNWNFRDKYKLFWYHMAVGGHPRDMLREVNGVIQPSETGEALHTLASILTNGDRIGTSVHPVETGFGIFSKDTAMNYFPPYLFRNYSFTIDDKIFIAAWLNLPAIEEFGKPIQVRIKGLNTSKKYNIKKQHFITGEESELTDYSLKDGELCLKVPPTNDPILYLVVYPE